MPIMSVGGDPLPVHTSHPSPPSLSYHSQELKAAGAQERHAHYEHCRASWKQYHQGEREGKREVAVQVGMGERSRNKCDRIK